MAGLESATYINDLVTTNPAASDPKAQGDDHLRLIKAVLQASFPNASRAFYVPTSVAAATGTVTIAASDQGKITPVSASGASRTVNLPANSGIPDGFECTVFKSDSSSNTVTIDGDSSDTINGALTYVLTKQFQGVRLIWLTTFASWIALPWISTIPYYSGGQDIPLSDIAPSANAKRLLGAETATDFSEQTITAVLEWVSASLARGDILMRGASAFDRFAPGSAGTFLTSGGTGADLTWKAAAAQSDMETGTSTTLPVTPGVQKYHPLMPKAWALFDGTITGTNAPSAGSGVASIQRTSTGTYTVNLTTVMSSTAYAVVVTCCQATSSSSAGNVFVASVTNLATGSFRILISDNNNDNLADAAVVSFIVMGDL